jgi:DNA-binding GntR family transcriptional regulator
MARVYQALKARVMAGAFAPGERIDPARLSADLAASATPIREALHRLAGERLVESWQQEGFRQPFVTEANLRDLYGWSEDLLRLLLRAIERNAAAPMRTPA